MFTLKEKVKRPDDWGRTHLNSISSQVKRGEISRLADFVLKFFAVLSACAAIFATWILLYSYLSSSPYFEVDRVEMSGGAVSWSEGEIRSAAGIVGRVNIFKIDLQKMERAIGADPWVQSVEVKRSLPNKLLIRVDERKPRALIDLDEIYLISRDGVLLDKLEAGGAGHGLPLIEGVEVKSPARGERVASAELSGALSFIDTFEAVKPLGELELKKIGRLNPTGLFFMAGALDAHFIVGGGDAASKLKRLKAISPDVMARASKWASVDLSFKDRVVVKYKKRGGDKNG